MTKYKVNYIFGGSGAVEIEANSKEEAQDKFESGDYNPETEEETMENYEVQEVEEIK